jgi:3''-phosphoadenosine 5''-phosphosulfate sulfotransferase (PAPS reductase)/FAD synthetase and related enzymes
MKHTLSLSGGKDSTWLLLELIRRGEPIDEAVFFDTEWEFPEMYEHISKCFSICKQHGIKTRVLSPGYSFDYLMFKKPVHERSGGEHLGYSWCGLSGCRWGTTEKLKALDECTKDSIVYVGIAADETHRLEKERKPNKRFPLVDWGITEAECLQGCYEAGFDWGGLYKHLDRVSCKYCALKNLKELRNIRKYYPKVWQELKGRQTRTARPYKGEGKSVFQLEARFVFEEERLAEGLSITNRDFYTQLAGRISAEAQL